MIRTLGAVVAAVAASWMIAPLAASADPVANQHDCAGVVVSALAGPGFGSTVSAAAQEQLVDNLGLADCGQTNRNNP